MFTKLTGTIIYVIYLEYLCMYFTVVPVYGSSHSRRMRVTNYVYDGTATIFL